MIDFESIHQKNISQVKISLSDLFPRLLFGIGFGSIELSGPPLLPYQLCCKEVSRCLLCRCWLCLLSLSQPQ